MSASSWDPARPVNLSAIVLHFAVFGKKKAAAKAAALRMML